MALGERVGRPSAQNSWTTCRLNSIECVRCSAMGFLLESPVQLADSKVTHLSTPGCTPVVRSIAPTRRTQPLGRLRAGWSCQASRVRLADLPAKRLNDLQKAPISCVRPTRRRQEDIKRIVRASIFEHVPLEYQVTCARMSPEQLDLPFTSPVKRPPFSARVLVPLLTEGVAAAPQNAKLWLQLAVAQAELKNWAAAAEAAREAVCLNSNVATKARLTLARISLMSGKPADALAVLEGDHRIPGLRASALMAATLECMGQWEAAAEKQSQVLESGREALLLSAWSYLEPTRANARRIEQRSRELLRKHMAVRLFADLMIAFAI